MLLEVFSLDMKWILQIFSVNMLSKVIVGLVGAVLIHFMAPPEYASYTFALACVALMTELLTSTFNTIYIAGYERLGLAKEAGSFLGVQLWAALALILVTLPLRPFPAPVYVSVVALCVANILSEFTRAVFRQELRFTQFATVQVVRSLAYVATLLPLVLFVRYGLAAWHALLVQATSLLIVFWFVVRRSLDYAGLLRMRQIIRLGRLVLFGDYRYLLGYSVTLAIVAQVDVFVLRALTDDLQLSTYGSAFRYYGILALALGSVNAVFLPVIQKIGYKKDLDSLYRKHLKMCLVFGPLTVLGAVLAQWVIPWVDTGRYPDAVMVFRLLAASSVISFVFSPHVSLVIRFEDFRFLFLNSCAGLVLCAVLNYFGALKLGAVGSAAATLVTWAFINISTYFRAQRYRTMLPD